MVPGREMQVYIQYLHFSSRYAMSISNDCKLGTNYYIPIEQQEFFEFEMMIYVIAFNYVWGPTFAWEIFIGTSKKILLTLEFFYVVLQREFDLHWIEIWDLITGTAYRLYPLHSLTNSLFACCIKIIDITKNIPQLLT